MTSDLDLDDVEALHLGSSFLTADALGPLLDHCEDALFGLSSLEEGPLSGPFSPGHSHHASLSEAKASALMLPWFGANDLLDMECPQEEDVALLAMEWVSEKMELGELELDSLLDSSDESPESPEARLTSGPGPDVQNPGGPLEPELSLKSEPQSPTHGLELCGETPHSDGETPHSDSDSGIESSPPHTPQSDRSKPYGRPQPSARPRPKAPKSVDKKLKKMEQNKTAATRYRKKKRVEQDELNAERLQLEQRNQELKEKVQAVSREIQYLQDLMEEVRRHHQNKRRTAVK